MSIRQTLNPHLLKREESILVIIDVQKFLMPVIAEGGKVIANVERLLKSARIMNLPLVVTEQSKLGPTVPEVKGQIADSTPILKTTFDALLCDEFAACLHRLNRKTLILAGVEAHVCIAQTAIHALPDYSVHVVSDAVSSRTRDNWKVGLERMRQHGAVITSTEMVIFELLQRAGTDEFKKVMPLVK